MNKKSNIIWGIILILIGVLFLAQELAPQYFVFWSWPVLIIGLGVIFLIWAIISGNGGLAVPACILAGIGGMFYYQQLTGDWESWAYAWTLIPGFVGVGVILSGIINRDFVDGFTSGMILIIISGGLFFAFVPNAVVPEDVTLYWPLVLVALGIIALVRAILRKK